LCPFDVLFIPLELPSKEREEEKEEEDSKQNSSSAKELWWWWWVVVKILVWGCAVSFITGCLPINFHDLSSSSVLLISPSLTTHMVRCQEGWQSIPINHPEDFILSLSIAIYIYHVY